MKKQWISGMMAGLMSFGLCTAAIPLPKAEADAGILAGVLGGAIVGTMYRDQVMGYYKQYNNTEKGRQAWFQQMKKEEGVDTNPALNARPDRIMTNVEKGIYAVDNTVYNKPYQYFISPKDEANAYCTIGHNVNVFRGIFNTMANDDELAVILGHELGHGQKDHPIKGVKSALNAQTVAIMANAATGGNLSGLIGQMYTITQNVHLTKPMEWEADNLSFDYITHTYYNPGATAAVWQRFLDKYGNSTGRWSDHPTHMQRRDNYVKKLYAWSNKHVNNKDGVIYVNGKEFMTPSAAGGMSSKERSYFVMGNLCAVYHKNAKAPDAYASGNVVMMGQQPIIQCVGSDGNASDLAARLNQIK